MPARQASTRREVSASPFGTAVRSSCTLTHTVRDARVVLRVAAVSAGRAVGAVVVHPAEAVSRLGGGQDSLQELLLGIGAVHWWQPSCAPTARGRCWARCAMGAGQLRRAKVAHFEDQRVTSIPSAAAPSSCLPVSTPARILRPSARVQQLAHLPVTCQGKLAHSLWLCVPGSALFVPAGGAPTTRRGATLRLPGTPKRHCRD